MYGLETRTVLFMFSLELEISGVVVQTIHQNNKKGCFYEELLSGNNFEAVLATFCYDYSDNTSEAV